MAAGGMRGTGQHWSWWYNMLLQKQKGMDKVSVPLLQYSPGHRRKKKARVSMSAIVTLRAVVWRRQ
eukprot:7541191-Ditylum_brightwellii.AAC.1